MDLLHVNIIIIEVILPLISGLCVCSNKFNVSYMNRHIYTIDS